MNKQIFCSRKGGATMETKFYPLRTSDILTTQIGHKVMKVETRIRRKEAKRG